MGEQTQELAVKALESEREMAEGQYHLEDDGTLDTVIGCNRCDWTGRYNPDVADAGEGYADGGEAYTDGELDLMRINSAYEMAAEAHGHDQGH